jgi:two-component system osmolarity sensor histidine kinase EnvZ
LGAGLGLAIVDRFARNFGGRLELSAREGGGLVASIFLPLGYT